MPHGHESLLLGGRLHLLLAQADLYVLLQLFEHLRVLFIFEQHVLVVTAHLHLLTIVWQHRERIVRILLHLLLLCVGSLVLFLVCCARIAVALLLLYVDNAQVKHGNGYLATRHVNVLLLVAQVELVLAILVQFVILFFELGGLLAELLCLLEQLEERALSVVRLRQLHLQLLAHGLVHLVVVVQLIEVIDELLVVLYCQVRLHLLHIFYLFLVARQLFLHFRNNLVRRLVALLHVRVALVEFSRLRRHISVKLFSI